MFVCAYLLEMGEDSPVKEIPHPECMWSSRTYISKRGRVKPSFYNSRTGQWVFGKERLPSYDAKGRQGFYLHGSFRPLASAICMAWGTEDFPSTSSRTMRTSVATTEDESEAIKEDWLPLSLKMGIVPCTPKHTFISNFGRVSQKGEILPHRVVYGTKVSHVKGFGLVPVDLIRKLLFEHKNPKKKAPPRVRTALRLARRLNRMRDVAREMAIKESTAWSYVHVGVRHVSLSTATRIIHKFVTPNATEAVMQLANDDPAILSDPLSEIVAKVAHILKDDGTWDRNQNKFSEVRAIRDLIQRSA